MGEYKGYFVFINVFILRLSTKATEYAYFATSHPAKRIVQWRINTEITGAFLNYTTDDAFKYVIRLHLIAKT